MNNNSSTSLHCHETKDTPMLLLQGKIKIKTLDDIISVNIGDICIINKKTFHSLISYDNNTILMELEIKPNKCDLFRYKDNYKRENSGYEDISKMLIENEYNSDKYFDYYKEYGNDKLLKKYLNTTLVFRNNYIQKINEKIYIYNIRW